MLEPNHNQNNNYNNTSPVNPYQAPAQPVVLPMGTGELVEAQKLPIGAGWDWVRDAWQIFRENIGLWLGVGLIVTIISIVASLLPIIGAFSGVLNVFFMAGVGYMAHRQLTGNAISVGDLFIGFQRNALQLFLIFVFAVVAAIVVVIILVVIGLMFGLSASAISNDNVSVLMIALVVLIALALFIPISMAMWFSPMLVLLNDVPAIDAMKMSFKGCLRNILPSLWYGVILTLLAILAIIPVGLGFLVLVPVAMISSYTAYRTIFTKV